jgi:hypothetical protein
MLAVKDVFNPAGLCNPGKVVPTTKTCRFCGFGIEDFRHKRKGPHGVVTEKTEAMTAFEERMDR